MDTSWFLLWPLFLGHIWEICIGLFFGQYLGQYLSLQYLGKYLSGKYLYFQYIGSSSLPSSPSLGLHVWSSLPGKVCLCRGLWHWSIMVLIIITLCYWRPPYKPMPNTYFSGKIGPGTCLLLKPATAGAVKIYQSWVLIDVIQKHQNPYSCWVL